MGIIKNIAQQLKTLIKRELGVDVSVTDVMTKAIGLWSDMYANKAPWLEEGKVQSLNMSSAIAAEVARLVTLEMSSDITGSARASYLQQQYAEFLSGIRGSVELAAAKGGIVFKPYIDGGHIVVDCVQADMFIPCDFTRGKLTAAIFVEEIVRGKMTYRRLEYHGLRDGLYTIKNRAYMTDNPKTELGREVPLGEVDTWGELQAEVVLSGVKQPLFSYFKTPFANNIDTQSPIGVSVYSRATEQIKDADLQYSRYLWEFEGSELAVEASEDLFKRSGNDKLVLPKGKERLYRTLSFDVDKTGSEMGLKTFNPEIREPAIAAGLDKIFRRIEFNCNLAYGTLSDPQTVDKTAEEIRASKQRSYTMISDTQTALENALNGLIYAMDVWATYGNLSPSGSYQVSFEWDDSIIVDAESEQRLWLQEVSSGLMTPVEYRMRRYGETEEQARAALPEMTTLTE